MNLPQPPAPAPRRRTSGFAWLLLLVMVPIAGALGWRAWQAETEARRTADAEETLRLDALAQRVAVMRDNQQAQGKRMQQSEATNRLLRDELLAIGQRAALLEDSVQRLADPAHDAARALRMDEIELLLAQGQQRLLVAADVDGARRAYALAARLADSLAAPGDIDLRQALVQERAMLDALGEDPRVRAVKRIDAFEAGFDAGPAGVSEAETEAESANGSGAPWWRRLARRIVAVRPSDDRLAVDSGEQAAGHAALRLELTLARTAAERRDADGHAAALARASAWLPRLRPASPARDALARELEAMAALPLTLALPELGTSLEQLRRLRGNDAAAAPDAVPNAAPGAVPDAAPDLPR
ncbi:uroporphyrinogen-III C-methyltransferase [Luteimonas sp. MJ204]|uniref:uroporphyrinogen-III C-methyltransferase n=1 Tax=Luteimonas sp. MJ145 TaxID=3129234 RepID=UPI0031B9E317